jgi:hypothetical protein
MKQIFDKQTLLVYLINELSDNFNYEVDTKLTPEGCWSGEVVIKEKHKTDTPLIDPLDYYIDLGKDCDCAKKHLTND